MTVIVPGGTLSLNRRRVTSLSWPTGPTGDISMIGWCRRQEFASFYQWDFRTYLIYKVNDFVLLSGGYAEYTMCGTSRTASVNTTMLTGPTTPFSQDCVVSYPAPENSKYRTWTGFTDASCTETLFPETWTVYDFTAALYCSWERGAHLCTHVGTFSGRPITISYDLMHTVDAWY